ncbi:MAG TPA: amidohydrolase family protein [Burkholderiales bacterium]|nr:amidohydrolase family protein [Burkholderiales bacterium]
MRAAREKLGHPIIDADAHVVECQFALEDTLKEAAGPRIAARFAEVLELISMHRWYRADEPTRRRQRLGRPSFWHVPASNTLDRATAMLPGLMRSRLDELGIDFAVVYTTLGLSFVSIPDEEMRRSIARALNQLNARTFREHSSRLTPVAIVPMGSPQEAIEELEYAVKTLGFKAAFLGGHFWRALPGGGRYMDYLALDSELDYDPVWAKCVELGVVPASHVGTLGGPTHGSITNYTFNHAGSFAAAGHILARALILGGVMKRFPRLRVAFLEGGAGWASLLYNTLVERFEKRNGREILRTLDPERQDRALMRKLFEQHGGPLLSRYAERIGRDQGSMLNPPEDRARVDDFAATGAEDAQAFAKQFVDGFYFGCEGEDRATVMAFDRRLNHFGHQLNAIFSSDLGHWDVPEMARVMEQTCELVEDGILSPEDFRKFTFTNVARMYTSMNPDFFKGTAVESAVAREIA